MSRPRFCRFQILLTTGLVLCSLSGVGHPQKPEATSYGEQMLKMYFQHQVNQIASQCLEDIHTLDDWTSRRETFRRQLFEMLGLWPQPEKTDLKATITGHLDQGEFVVEKLYYQSLPGLYVTANLYRPKEVKSPLPAVLYLCGHGNIKKGGISYGSKTSYQHHPAWFARHGFVSLVLDTLQLGEIEGVHHGTYREQMWWWMARGYTPAGVEAWNAIRALDYLQTRPEVDATRIGVTGRSGGGAYSWWLAALDDRITVAVPVAGITDLQNHVVDGAIEGHCDCMYMINTYRWDFPLVAALVAPRPLLLSNSDKDRIFPLDGVVRVHEKLRRIYRLYGAEERLGLLITEGPHRDTQDLQIPAFRWMARWLKGQDLIIDKPAVKFFEPEQLKVFEKMPEDQLNTRIHERFVPPARAPEIPKDEASWRQLRQQWLQQLRESAFAGWPQKADPLETKKMSETARRGLRVSAYQFNSQAGLPLRLWLISGASTQKSKQVVVKIVTQPEWEEWLGSMAVDFSDRIREIVGTGWEATPTPAANTARLETIRKKLVEDQSALAIVAPRGIGPTAWPAKKEAQILRRFVLVGQTLDGMRVWDVRRALASLRQIADVNGVSLRLEGRGLMAGIALYASLFEPDIAALDLWDLPTSHRNGPIFLNIQKMLDMPQALAMALPNSRVVLYHSEPAAWAWPRTLAENLKWDASALQFRTAPDSAN